MAEKRYYVKYLLTTTLALLTECSVSIWGARNFSGVC